MISFVERGACSSTAVRGRMCAHLVAAVFAIAAFAGSASATPYRYFELTVTSNGSNGAEFSGGFAGFSGTGGTGTNMFATFGSLTSSPGWIFSGFTATQFLNFQAGPRPYFNGNGGTLFWALDTAREVDSITIANYIAEGSAWWITGIRFDGSNDGTHYDTLYNGPVTTAQSLSSYNLTFPGVVPEPASLGLLGAALLTRLVRGRATAKR